MDLYSTVSSIDVFAREHQNVVLACTAVIGVLLIYYLGNPRRLERAMAKRKERENVAQIISDAMQDAVHQKKLSVKAFRKYQIKLGKSLSLPGLIPMSATSRWPTNFHLVNLKQAKVRCIQRLSAMGVNIAHGLDKIRSMQKREKARPQVKRRST